MSFVCTYRGLKLILVYDVKEELKLKKDIYKIINKNYDSVLIYKFRTKNYYERQEIGINKPSHEDFIF